MRKNMQLKEGFPQRYLEFMNHFGLNPNSLASALGDTARVKFHKYKTGESEPNSTSLFVIASHYPISLDWLILGEGPMLRHESLTITPGDPTPDPPTTTDALYADLQQRYTALQHEHAVLAERAKGLGYYSKAIEHMYKKLDPSFTESSSQSTAMQSMECVMAQYRREAARVLGLESSKVRDARISSSASEAIVRELWPIRHAMSA